MNKNESGIRCVGSQHVIRRIDEVPLSFRAKRDSWKHSIHFRFITLHIESFEPILLCISSPLSPFYVQLPCQLIIIIIIIIIANYRIIIQ